MALPSDYSGQACSLARALEVVGERWTLLIMRDAFFGVRRFGDFAAHLGIPRAVLAERLKSLAAADVLARVPAPQGHQEYELTAKGIALWPAIRALTAWGDEYYAPKGPRRILRHAEDEALVDPAGQCTGCGAAVGPADTLLTPGPGLDGGAGDPVTVALAVPHRLLEPLRH